MKTNEEKLLKLLQIAIENGYTLHDSVNLHFIIYAIENNKCRIETGLKNLTIVCNGQDTYSLNDLVINWEPGEISFIQALGVTKYQKSYKQIDDCDEYWLDNVEETRVQWILQPTSKRLQWLFETFKHLLN